MIRFVTELVLARSYEGRKGLATTMLLETIFDLNERPQNLIPWVDLWGSAHQSRDMPKTSCNHADSSISHIHTCMKLIGFSRYFLVGSALTGMIDENILYNICTVLRGGVMRIQIPIRKVVVDWSTRDC
jgi:hypothetical protein